MKPWMFVVLYLLIGAALMPYTLRAAQGARDAEPGFVPWYYMVGIVIIGFVAWPFLVLYAMLTKDDE